MTVIDSPTETPASTQTTSPAPLTRRLVRSLALRMLAWTASTDPAAETSSTGGPTTGAADTPRPAAPSPDTLRSQQIRRHHLQRALEQERDRATARARMSPFYL